MEFIANERGGQGDPDLNGATKENGKTGNFRGQRARGKAERFRD